MTPEMSVVTTLLLLPSLTGVALSQGKTGSRFLDALNFQPHAFQALQRILLISLAILETGGILSLVIWLVMLQSDISTPLQAVGAGGVICAMAIPGFLTSFRSYHPIQHAFNAVARHPRLGQSVMNLLLLLLSFIQTPLIFGTIVSWFIIAQDQPEYIADSVRLLAAGGILGLGTIGPIIGLTRFAGQSFTSIGRYTDRYNDVVSFTFVSQAIIETPILFALVLSLFVIFVVDPSNTSHYGIPYVLAMFCIFGTTYGAGLSSSRTAMSTCEGITHHPQSYRSLVRTSVLAQTLIDTAAIYGLIIGFFFIFT